MKSALLVLDICLPHPGLARRARAPQELAARTVRVDLVLCARSCAEVAAAVVQPVPVFVIRQHSRRGSGDLPMHPDTLHFPVNADLAYRIDCPAALANRGSPFVAQNLWRVGGIYGREVSARKRDKDDIGLSCQGCLLRTAAEVAGLALERRPAATISQNLARR